ncbi:MAG: choice-of-anchor Q domain-containing protein [Candidatus Tenebribacter mawsonii]|nr:choice-of-anchor Q domain-containing protein [Candidatus Tenebribacter mawsonii]
MKIRFYLLFVFVSFCLPWCIPGSLLNSTIHHIKQDGTGNFTTIQEGIAASADSDTVLVYPGIFIENINFNGKNITVASLYLTTQNEQYINQTIIDGNQNGSCVRIMSGEDSTTVLCGFTITNGTGSAYYEDGPICGGGIFLMNTQVNIANCNIKNNNSYWGGGIFCRLSQITLLSVTIINNNAGSGGGIYSREDSEIVFDQTELCNIYLNYAGYGCEILKTYSSPPMEVYVDTFTVFEPDGYFIHSTTTTGVPLNDVIMVIQNAKLEPVNADLYVSINGDNSNSGLFADEPLATINYALSLVKSDTLHPNTIHIADGTYSKSLNNNCFPLCMRGYVSLIGESMENTILDAENISPHIYDIYSKLDYEIKNLTLTNGSGFTVASILISAHQQLDKYVNLENITIIECYAYTKNLKLFYMNLSIKNIYSYSNESTLLWALNSFQSEQSVIIENAYINDNHQYNPMSEDSDAGPQLSFGMLGTLPMNVTIINMELTENIQTQTDWPGSSSGFGIGDNVNLNLINCTIGNNSSPGNGGAIKIGPAGKNSVINIYNSILYGDSPGEIYIDNEFSSNPSTINIHNSLVDGGFEGIENVYSWNVVNWMEGNLDEDPYWDVNGDNPYALMGNSPCIDAGTLDLPPGIELPEFDLAGNPRIVNGMIDMGAYECQDPSPVQEDIITPITLTQISNYPNPFNPSTTIKLDLAEPGEIELAIYNIKGQKVKTLMDAYSTKGHFEIIWRGIDDNKKKVASGQYFIKLKVNGKEKALSKCLLLK